ncbi:MAG: hypothetical protein ETSY2_06525 [Candidatus Entotheonella gemina]|uniref:Uncharacterized protein n=1 Tax=Candidatus Entotheonella gemina TaxID=1429439 RepID=W4MF15_9BACT|nr:MAG: hypothetical protein ETSY2_06525 [Candidatus Entotheonella gemina]
MRPILTGPVKKDDSMTELPLTQEQEDWKVAHEEAIPVSGSVDR